MADSGAQDGKWVTIKGHRVFLKEGEHIDSFDSYFAAKLVLDQLRKETGITDKIKEANDKIEYEKNIKYHTIEKEYISTSKSFDINKDLRNKEFNDIGLGKSRTIKCMDNVMEPSPYDFGCFRAIDSGKWLEDIKVGSEITDKGFMSVSIDRETNAFSYREIYMNIKVPKGHKIYPSTNYSEGEIVLSRNTKYRVTGVASAEVPSKWDPKDTTIKTVLDCEVIDD